MQDHAPVIDGVSFAAPDPGHNLPPRAFTSPAVFEHEQRAIFANSWVHVADTWELAAPGGYVTALIGRTPVVIIRERITGELRGLLNACRHRGAQLLDGKGTCDKQIQCPYHAWSYGLDGRLLGAPHRDELAHCNLAEMNLVPVRVGTVGPLVFACLDPEAPELADWVGELAGSLAGSRIGEWTLAWENSYELAANWKLFVENANDGYHVPFVHDLLTDAIVLDPATSPTTLEPHGAYTWAQVNPNYVPPGTDPASARVRFGCIFPNFIPVLSPDDLTYFRVEPIAHDRMRIVARSYDDGLAENAPLREFRRIAAERTMEQDLAVVLRTQRGLHAIGLPPGVHTSRLEARIGHFERMWADAMASGCDTPVTIRRLLRRGT